MATECNPVLKDFLSTMVGTKPMKSFVAENGTFDFLEDIVSSDRDLFFINIFGEERTGKTFTSFFIAEQLKETFGGGITYVSLATIKDHPDHCWQRIVSQRKASSSIYGKESRLKESAKISLAAFEDKVLIIDDINTEKEVEAILDEYNAKGLIILISKTALELPEELEAIKMNTQEASPNLVGAITHSTLPPELKDDSEKILQVINTHNLRYLGCIGIMVHLLISEEYGQSFRSILDQKVHNSLSELAKSIFSVLSPEAQEILTSAQYFRDFFTGAQLAFLIEKDQERVLREMEILEEIGLVDSDPTPVCFQKYTVAKFMKQALPALSKQQIQTFETKSALFTLRTLMGLDFIYSFPDSSHQILALQMTNHQFLFLVNGIEAAIFQKYDSYPVISLYRAKELLGLILPPTTLQKLCFHFQKICSERNLTIPTLEVFSLRENLETKNRCAQLVSSNSKFNSREKCSLFLQLASCTSDMMEGLQYAKEAVQIAKKEASVENPSSWNTILGNAYELLAEILIKLSQLDKADEMLSKSLDHFSANDMLYDQMRVLCLRGSVEIDLKTLDKALLSLTEALKFAQQVGSFWEEYELLHLIGKTLSDKGNKVKAAKFLHTSLEAMSGVLDPVPRAYRMWEAASVDTTNPQKKAAAWLQESFHIFQNCNKKDMSALSLNALGLVLAKRGSLKTRKHLEDAIVIAKDDTLTLGITQHHLGNYYRDIGEFDKSIPFLKQSLENSTSERQRTLRLNGLGVALYRKGMTIPDSKSTFEAAENLFKQALEVAENMNEIPLQVCVLHNLGALSIATKDIKSAINYCERGLALNAGKDPSLDSECLHYLGIAQYEQRNVVDAVATLKKAIEKAKQAEKRPLEIRLLREIGAIYSSYCFRSESIRYFTSAFQKAESDPILGALISFELATEYRMERDASNFSFFSKMAITLAKKTQNDAFLKRMTFPRRSPRSMWRVVAAIMRLCIIPRRT